MADEDMVELERQLSVLEERRKRLFACGQKLLDGSMQVTANNHHMYQGAYDRLAKVQEDYDNCQEEIIDCNTRLPTAKRLATEQQQERFDELVQMAQMNFLKYKLPRAATNAESPSNMGNLGPLTVPKFNGDATAWPTFFNLFNAAVHTHPTCSKTVKFQRLLSYLTGEPLSMIGTMDITEANYDAAYEMLKDRYQSEKKCILRHYQGFLELPPVSNSAHLSSMLSKLREHTHALTALKHEKTSYSTFLVAVIITKLSVYYRRRLDDFRAEPTEYPTLDEVIDFLKAECSLAIDTPSSSSFSVSKSQSKVFLAQNQNRRKSYPSYANRNGNSHSGTSASNAQKPAPMCAWCSGQHIIYQCEKFRKATVHERREGVREKGLCYNCLSSHRVKSCNSERMCSVCNQKHHSLLHVDETTVHVASIDDPPLIPTPIAPEIATKSSITNDSAVDVAVNAAAGPSANMVAADALPDAYYTVLPTARLLIASPSGQKLSIRALLDSCAQNSFITTDIAQILHLSPTRDVPAVTGLSQVPVSVDGVAKIDILDRKENVVISGTKVIVVKRITGTAPSIEISSDVRDRLKNHKLADNEFYRPGPINALFGADVVAQILTGQKIDLGPNAPIGLGTIFGLTIMGRVPARNPTPSSSTHVVAMLTQTSLGLSEQIEKFWSLEEVGPASKLTPDEEAAEEFYKKTTEQQSNGRYSVRLPFRPNHPPLGRSRFQAENRFASLERRFSRDPEYHKAYVEFMKNYEDSKFMTRIRPEDVSALNYFLAHHGVIKASSTTTKTRVVYDASAPSSNGVSLNDVLLPGPKLQNDIRHVLLNFRRHIIVFSADIRQMFLQVDLHKDDRCYQYILWRPTPNEPISVYSLDTVTFGISSSPFLAIRTLIQLARDHGADFPEAARILLEDIYVDDICSGCDDVEKAREILRELTALMSRGRFELRKWTSNHPEILSEFSAQELELPSLDDPNDPRFTILGLLWLAGKDAFTYTINTSTPSLTKRGILSAIATIYDPCGWIAPVVFSAKAFMQQLWLSRLDWDDPLPIDISQKWSRFLTLLPALGKITIPRLMHSPGAKVFQIHGFCDASEAGYSASIYLRSAIDSDAPASVNLILAKTRVAPLKTVSLPRLELCAAALLADVLKNFSPQLEAKYDVSKTMCWSDSTVALSWIRLPPYRLKTFIANRVAAIQELNADIVWRHVRSADNPADCASRGLLPPELPDHTLWWHGPAWLSEPASNWPIPIAALPDEKIPELKNLNAALITAEPQEFFPPFSSWHRATRVLGWIARFIDNVKNRVRTASIEKPMKKPPIIKNIPENIHLTTSELKKAEMWLVRNIQRESFDEEFKRLQKNQLCSKRVQHLSPFVDKQGILRVGGRLRHASLSEDAKHPILLPGDHALVRLLAKKYHRENLHAGPRLLQATLARRFWILSCRNLVRSCVHDCIQCFRARPTNKNPRMGDLPPARVHPNPIFSHSGMDFAGPFQVKIHQLRSARTVNVYLCVFVCLSTKAVHLEIAHDLSTPAFIAALQRFAARRGCPTQLHSDCGTNFVGASNEFARIVKNSLPEVVQTFPEMQFKFNPPAAPHQGGIWESAVKSAKSHLTRTLGNTVLILEEFQTLCCRVEAMLNSRPLTALSADPNDLQPLTPGHFIIGRPLNSPPANFFSDDEIPRLRRWTLVEALFQRIWRRWQLEYVHTLQPRGKWTADHPSIKIDDLVLLHDPNAPPLQWKMGRVTKVHPGADARVRVATVRTASGELTRPVHKLYPLPAA